MKIPLTYKWSLSPFDEPEPGIPEIKDGKRHV